MNANDKSAVVVTAQSSAGARTLVRSKLGTEQEPPKIPNCSVFGSYCGVKSALRPKPQHSNTPSLINFCFLLSTFCFCTAGHSQTFTTIKSFGFFTNISGFNPQSTLVQGLDGTLYGTTRFGEASV